MKIAVLGAGAWGTTLADMLEGSRDLLAGKGRWLAMKGAAPMAELRELPPGYVADVATLEVPGEIGSRHLVIVEKVA